MKAIQGTNIYHLIKAAVQICCVIEPDSHLLSFVPKWEQSPPTAVNSFQQFFCNLKAKISLILMKQVPHFHQFVFLLNCFFNHIPVWSKKGDRSFLLIHISLWSSASIIYNMALSSYSSQAILHFVHGVGLPACRSGSTQSQTWTEPSEAADRSVRGRSGCQMWEVTKVGTLSSVCCDETAWPRCSNSGRASCGSAPQRRVL